jgi:hypothetical protein
MVGMTKLFTFVKLLEEDWLALMHRTAIEYGLIQSKTNVDVSKAMGWDKKQKRQEAMKNETLRNNQERHRRQSQNNGCAPTS